MSYLTEITTEHGTYTGQTIHSIIRREYGHNAFFRPTPDPNDPYRGQILSPSRHDQGAYIVEATVMDWMPGTYETRLRDSGSEWGEEDMGEGERMSGHRLRQVRQAFNLSGANLAKRLGVREDTLHRWEKDRDPVPYKVPADLQEIGEELIGEIRAGIESLEDLV